ncbi:coiled-coil domain-containing protein 150 isoform 2-T3 [Anomaloglossus baeobatrachus]|uniref:coiled-coil domain-containing protein 150 isoform X2 n=1 Tax=Anomaloglossus baeobatrachus TaxID=238106 RepID=UPI003F5034CC
MARPVIAPLTILPTAPEVFSVLEQRMRVAEDQADSLISDLQALGVSGHRFKNFEVVKSTELFRPISPVRARPVFSGDGDTLWRNCENLVTRMCHMESMLQTLKLNVFRLHTDRELSTKLSGELEHRLLQMQEEHAQEQKEVQLEVMRLRQRLNAAIEERKREQEAKERLSAALEIATTTKTDVTIAVEELKATKASMSQRLAKLQDKLSQEAALRALLEEEQAALLLAVQDMKDIVEEERTQVQELQQYCQKISREGNNVKDKLEDAESRCQVAEKNNQQLRIEIEAKVSQVAQLQEDIKIIKQKCEKGEAEVTQVRADSVTLREAAEKVQSLNQQLENQCSELTKTVQKVTNQNQLLMSQHQQELKVIQDTMAKKLQEQETLLSVVQTSLSGEVQKILSERTQLERELETLCTEHSKCTEKVKHSEQKKGAQMELQENTIAGLRADLDSALQNRTSLEKEKMLLQEELYKTLNDFMEKKQNLEVHLTESKLEQELLQSSLWVQEQENKRLVERVALLEQEQHTKRQVESLLNELTDSKNKLAYEKGKLQSTVQQLQSDLQSFGEAHSENSKLRKMNATLQARYTQVNSELDSNKIRLQKLEAKLQKTEQVLLSKEQERALAVQARDEAMNEEKRLRQQIDTFKETEGHTKAIVQQKLSDVCEERTRMSETLENVLSSHAKLQKDLETLQTELGRKDNDLLCLHKDRSQNRKRVERLKAELLECNAKLHTTECQQREMEPLQKYVEVAREDNRKLAHTLNLTLQKNSTLQNHVNELQKALQSKELQEKQIILNQAKAEDDYNIKEKLFGEKLVSLKKQHQVESKEAKKVARKELTELKKALDSVTAKSTELSRTNQELRNRESMLEKETLHQKELIRNLKIQLKSHIEGKGVKPQNEKIEHLQAELKHMKNMKESYEKNNDEQCKRIQEFMNEVDSMRKEINAATSQDAKEPNLLRQLEEEVTSRQKLEQRCKELECRVQKLQQVELGTEISIRDDNRDSEQITVRLQEANRWLQSKFNELQLEILKNSQKNVKEEINSWKMSPHFPASAVEHWETKQRLQLISRNVLRDDKPT